MTFPVLVYKLVSSVIVPAVLLSILSSISILILHNDIDINEIKKYFGISFLIGVILSTGSYTIILPLLSVITIVQLRNTENEGNIKILINIYSVYFANMIYTFIYTFLGVNLDNIPIKHMLIQFIIMLFIIVPMCYIIKNALSKKKYNKIVSSTQIIYRMILIINILLTIIIASIYIFTCTSLIDDKKNLFIMGNVVPEILPLISIIITSIIVYLYDKSVEFKVNLQREIEEKNKIEEYSHIIEDM
jgi:two-component system sensor histidine kinase AgrC